MKALLAAWVIGAFALLADGAASRMAPPVLNVKSYVSPSGKMALEVDPSERYGRGPARYRLSVEGRELWSAELPFTFADAAVGDDGTTAGYAYSDGLEGFPIQGGYAAGPGTLTLAILAPDGKVRRQEKIKREHTGVLHGLPDPVARGVLLFSDDDRCIFRLVTEADAGENFRSFRLSDGEALGRFDLRKTTATPIETARHVAGARAIGGTPLTLVHWWRYGAAARQSGALFMLLDAEGRPVWSLTREADNDAANEEARDRIRQIVHEHGAIVSAKERGRFELWFPAAGQRVLFSVEPDAGEKSGWRVSELSRQKHELPPEPTLTPPAVEKRPLPLLGSFVLQDNPVAGPIRDIEHFEFDDRGRIGFLRSEGRTGYTFVLLESAGAVVEEMPLPPEAAFVGTWRIRAVWIEGERWLAVRSEPGDEGKTRAWWLDAGARTATPIEPFDAPRMEAVAGTGDGGFALLATRPSRYSSTDELLGYDRDGKLRWKVESKHDENKSGLFSPEDMTLAGNGEIAVVDNIWDVVQLFDRAGKHHKTIDLKKAWGREPNYPSGITPDAAGGFIVYDFNGKVPFVRMKPDGSVRAKLTPRHADGRAVDPRTGLRAAPDGRLWASDGHALLRLKEDGTVDRTLGAPPRDESLGKIAATAAGPDRRLYAVDERTGAIHVFDAEGKKVRVCKPAKGDVEGNLISPHITVADDGSVFLCPDRNRNKRGYLHFDPQGRRIGTRKFFQGTFSEEWHVRQDADGFLIVGYQDAWITDGTGAVQRKIDRRPNREWLDSAGDAAFAPDGSFAILAGSTHAFGENLAINFYTRDGAPLHTVPLPFSYASLCGVNATHFVLSTEAHGVFLYQRTGAPVQSFPAPGESGASGQLLTRDGRELWLIDFATREVDRHAMP